MKPVVNSEIDIRLATEEENTLPDKFFQKKFNSRYCEQRRKGC